MSRRTVSAVAVLVSLGSLSLSVVSLMFREGKEDEPTTHARVERFSPFAAADSDEPDDGSDHAETPAAPAPAPIPSLRADAALARKLDAARDFAESDSWEEVTQSLQSVLDGPDDTLVTVKRDGRNGREATAWAGVRTEASRQLGALPPHGREFYEAMYGPRARRLLAEARAKGDVHLVADVARRYAHTAAGAEATGLLGAHHLDRGRYALAALCYERLLERPSAHDLPAVTLFHAALAFRRGGSEARAAQAWRLLAAKAPAGLRFGESDVGLEELRREIGRGEGPAEDGVPPRAARLAAQWSRPTTREITVLDKLQSAERRHTEFGRPVLSGGRPVVAGGRVMMRTARGLRAVDLRTGTEAWEAPSPWSMEHMLAEPRFASNLDSWTQSYLDVSPQVLFENTVLGVLGTDGGRVYAVDDLAVPPYRQNFGIRGRWQPQAAWPDFGPGLTEAAYHSRLLALDVATGRPAWEVGGHGGESDDDELSDTYFFGPPTALDDRLYAVTEKNSVLSLVCLRAQDGALVWRLPLAYPPSRLLLDPGRRIQAARPVWGEGVLVCPTNSGAVVGVDVLTPGLVWAYPYHRELLTRSEAVLAGRRGRTTPAYVAAEWKAPTTVIDGGRVIFSAADEPSVHCLDVRDGTLLWKAARTADDVYVAGAIAGKVLIVGRQGCRALGVADGKQQWWLATGMPSGLGAASGDVYYLPIREAGTDKQPAVYAVDVRAGEVAERVPCPANQPPGNLLLGPEEIISQSVTAVTAYRGEKR